MNNSCCKSQLIICNYAQKKAGKASFHQPNICDFKLKSCWSLYHRKSQYRRSCVGVWDFYYKLLKVCHERRHNSRFNFPNLIFFNFYSIAWRTSFYTLLYFTSFQFITTVLNFYKVEKLFKLWRHFECPRISFCNIGIYFCPHISPNVPIWPKMPNNVEFL